MVALGRHENQNYMGVVVYSVNPACKKWQKDQEFKVILGCLEVHSWLSQKEARLPKLQANLPPARYELSLLVRVECFFPRRSAREKRR